MKKIKNISTVLAVLSAVLTAVLVIADYKLKEKIFIGPFTANSMSYFLFLFTFFAFIVASAALLAEKIREGRKGKWLAVTAIIVFCGAIVFGWWAAGGLKGFDHLIKKKVSPDGKHTVYYSTGSRVLGDDFHRCYVRTGMFTYKFCVTVLYDFDVEWNEESFVLDGRSYPYSDYEK